ncbi:hypothetical protein AMTRI_Chr10g230540 [Amborella trichopoda]
MLSRIKSREKFKGIQITNSNIVVSHLQYVDDTVILCDADEIQIQNIVRFFEICEVVIGLKVNLHKSSLVGINCTGPSHHSLALVLGCKVESFPISYLGLPISDSKFPIAVWDRIIERVQVKLDLWKYKYLSLGGRVTLLRSCLANLPIYQMSVIHMLASVAKSIEKLMRDVLWGTHGDNNKFYFLIWDRVCTPKQEGGLGIRSLRYFNEALICKWWWQNAHFRNHLWCQVLIAKYGLESYGVWIGGGQGKEISYMWKAIYNCRPMVTGYFRWNIGCGRQVSFLYHKWVGDYPLKCVFIDVYRLASNKNILVCDVEEKNGGRTSWSIPLIYRRLSDMEQAKSCAMMKLLERAYVAQNAEDIFVWKLEIDGLFSVKPCYNLFFHDRVRWSVPSIAQIWKWQIPLKVQIFVWLAPYNKILTVDNLIKRGKILPNICLLCKQDGKSKNHMLIHCPFVSILWHWLMNVIGVSFPLPHSVMGLLHHFSPLFLPKVGRTIWEIAIGGSVERKK